MAVPLTVVKSTQSFTLEFVGATANPCLTKGLINSTPNILASGNSYFFNYSHSKNSNDLKFLKIFFDTMSVGNTCAFSSGVYVNIDTGAKTTWSGQFTLQGKTGAYNEFLYFSGLTGTSGLAGGIYDANLFTDAIQFTTINGSTANILLSKLPNNDPLNLKYLGLYGSDFGYEEYVEVEKSTLNTGRIPVKNFTVLNDGSEVVLLSQSSTITNENLYFQNSLVSTYMRGIPSIEALNYDETINGVVRYNYVDPGVFTRFIEYQNKKQFELRYLTTAPYDISKSWYQNTTLKSLTLSTNTPITTPISLELLKIYHLTYRNSVVSDFVASTDFQIPLLLSNTTINEIYVDEIVTNTLTITAGSFVRDINFKIDLSDSRNYGTLISAFADRSCSIPLTGLSYLLGTPGTEGAAFVFAGTETRLNTNIFLRLERETTSILELIVLVN